MPNTALPYIAAAFFKVRISLAAAIAAGVPCLSDGGGVAPCAMAGLPASASPSATQMAAKIRVKPIISFSSIDNANSLCARQDDGAGKADEQSVLDNARYHVQQACQ